MKKNREREFMKGMAVLRLFIHVIAHVSMVLLAAANTASAQATSLTTVVTPPAHAAGQSATLLPDGLWLLVGGTGSGSVSGGIAVVNASGTQTLPINLVTPRTGHTATVLPNGTVFVFGGVGAGGEMVSTAEILDLASNTVESMIADGLILRTQHTATLLTDRRLLLTGGKDGSGNVIANAQLWDPSTWTTGYLNPALQLPRYGQVAQLLGNGEVQISGGQSNGGQTGLANEYFDPSSNVF